MDNILTSPEPETISVEAQIPRPEYPRPQFVRSTWVNLNGEWEFAFDDEDAGSAQGWHLGVELKQHITVPFPYQAALSGIGDTGIHPIIWYARSFEIPANWLGMNVLVHFGAVDYQCTVWVNGHEVGHNRGGHTPFHFNVAPYINTGINRIAVRVVDTQSPEQPRGKQSITGTPHDIDYFCTSGIWQTVWLEPVPPIRIDEIQISCSVPDGTLNLAVYLHAPWAPRELEIEVLDGNDSVETVTVDMPRAVTHVKIKIPNAKLWSPEEPNLYGLRIRLRENGELVDEISSYAGLRDIEIKDGAWWVNGKRTYLRMVLDQGYWSESYLAAPSDAALRADVEWAKKFGFNGVRKHQKIEDPRWLYWCDILGLLVWSEMPNARKWSIAAEEGLASEWRRVIERDYNHPSIVAWVPINESMGFPGLKENNPAQYAFVERIVGLTRELDSYRPIIDNDGWEHSDVTDICAIHDYTPTASLLERRYHETARGGPLPAHVWIDNKPLFVLGSKYRGQPIMLSEVGGFLQVPAVKQEEDADILFQFYGSWRTPEEFLEKYRDLMQGIASLRFIAGFCYTQLADIEQETNGLLTYDRKPKLSPETIADIHTKLFGS